MKRNQQQCTHAPAHRLFDSGIYMVTCGTYQKHRLFDTPQRLTFLRNLLFELSARHGWQLQAWAIMSNHYHFVASSSDHPESLRIMLSTLHTLSARHLNRLDKIPKRRVWQNHYNSRITHQRSWLARLKYVHHNPVYHGIVQNAVRYPWCSAAWFTQKASRSFVKTVNRFKIDSVSVYDDYM